eukprot:2768263-Pleurochrysis_carterae.AAC.2
MHRVYGHVGMRCSADEALSCACRASREERRTPILLLLQRAWPVRAVISDEATSASGLRTSQYSTILRAILLVFRSLHTSSVHFGRGSTHV